MQAQTRKETLLFHKERAGASSTLVPEPVVSCFFQTRGFFSNDAVPSLCFIITSSKVLQRNCIHPHGKIKQKQEVPKQRYFDNGGVDNSLFKCYCRASTLCWICTLFFWCLFPRLSKKLMLVVLVSHNPSAGFALTSADITIVQPSPSAYPCKMRKDKIEL